MISSVRSLFRAILVALEWLLNSIFWKRSLFVNPVTYVQRSWGCKKKKDIFQKHLMPFVNFLKTFVPLSPSSRYLYQIFLRKKKVLWSISNNLHQNVHLFFCSLPQIVSTFHGPVDLCTAVRDQVEAWQLLGLTYFSAVSDDELQMLENTLTDLKEKR